MTKVVPASPGFSFFDGFDGAAVDATQWTVLNRDSDQSNSELCWYLPANVTVANSYLQITSQVQSSGGRAYTSGMLQSNFAFTYGTLEFRAKMGGGLGPWPGCLWLLGANCQLPNVSSAGNIGTCNWPVAGSDEINIAEFISSSYTSCHQGIHSGAYNPTNQPAVSDATANWHNYKIIWTAGQIIWQIDGTQTAIATNASVPSWPVFIIINVSVGGTGGGAVTNGTLPVTMLIDWVKVTSP